MKSRPLLIRFITAMIVATSMSCSGGNTRISAISINTLTENNKPLPESWSPRKEPGKLIIRIGSGKYSFSARH